VTSCQRTRQRILSFTREISLNRLFYEKYVRVKRLIPLVRITRSLESRNVERETHPRRVGRTRDNRKRVKQRERLYARSDAARFTRNVVASYARGQPTKGKIPRQNSFHAFMLNARISLNISSELALIDEHFQRESKPIARHGCRLN